MVFFWRRGKEGLGVWGNEVFFFFLFFLRGEEGGGETVKRTSRGIFTINISLVFKNRKIGVL